MSIRTDSQLLEPGSKVSLYKLDAGMIDPLAGTLYFHPHAEDGVIVWQGIEYHPWPINIDGLAKTGDRPPTPKLTVANIDGSITALCLQFDDLVGSVLTMRSTLTKYLDAVNFQGPNLISNGTFDTDLSGWTVQGGTVGWDAGRMRLGDAAVKSHVTIGFPTEAGETYTLKFSLDALSGLGNQIGTTPLGQDVLTNGNAVDGDTTRTFIGTGGTVYLRFNKSATTESLFVDNVQVYAQGVNETADPNEHFPDEIWYLDRKDHEDHLLVRWELASALDFNGIVLPSRIIVANQCGFMYRDADCGYAGGPVAKYDDTPTSDPTLDNCSRRVSGCKLRFGEDEELPYGSFPAAGLVRS